MNYTIDDAMVNMRKYFKQLNQDFTYRRWSGNICIHCQSADRQNHLFNDSLPVALEYLHSWNSLWYTPRTELSDSQG